MILRQARHQHGDARDADRHAWAKDCGTGCCGLGCRRLRCSVALGLGFLGLRLVRGCLGGDLAGGWAPVGHDHGRLAASGDEGADVERIGLAVLAQPAAGTTIGVTAGVGAHGFDADDRGAQVLPRQRLHVALQPACSAAIMSQVTIGGGDRATCGLLPTLTSFMGAAVPHSVPSRMGCSGTATTSRPFSRAAQRAWACSISCCDHCATARGLAGGLVRQHLWPLCRLDGRRRRRNDCRRSRGGGCGVLRKCPWDGDHAACRCRRQAPDAH